MSKVNKPRLGRGLSSLMSVTDDSPDLTPAPSMLVPPADGGSPPTSNVPLGERVIRVAVDEVKSNPHQPRREFNEASLRDLANSLKSNGLIQPIVVRQVGQTYELIAGERRLRAAKLAGLVDLPAIVKEVDGLTQAQLALVENIQREDLNPIDRAQAYQVLLQQLGLSHAELAMRLGEDRSTVSNHLRLLELAVPARDYLKSGQLTLGHAKVLAGVSDVLEQERLSKLVVDQELSVRNLEKVVAGGTSTKGTKVTVGQTAHLKSLEKAISQQLGMRVNVRSRQKGAGKLVVHFKDLDQFDELMNLLKVRISDEG